MAARSSMMRNELEKKKRGKKLFPKFPRKETPTSLETPIVTQEKRQRVVKKTAQQYKTKEETKKLLTTVRDKNSSTA